MAPSTLYIDHQLTAGHCNAPVGKSRPTFMPLSFFLSLSLPIYIPRISALLTDIFTCPFTLLPADHPRCHSFMLRPRTFLRVFALRENLSERTFRFIFIRSSLSAGIQNIYNYEPLAVIFRVIEMSTRDRLTFFLRSLNTDSFFCKSNV